jgi:hypothetical protein
MDFLKRGKSKKNIHKDKSARAPVLPTPEGTVTNTPSESPSSAPVEATASISR